MNEPRDIRLKRMRMRSWHRGTKEMDEILGAFADSALPDLSPAELEAYDRLLAEDDQDLYAWVSGREEAPEDVSGMIDLIRRHTLA